MGENARRLSDGKVIKIGRADTNNLYYLRYQDRKKLEAVENSIDPRTIENSIWRLPLPDEDHLQPGDYASHTPFIYYDKSSKQAYIHTDCDLSFDVNKLLGELDNRSGIYQLIKPELGLMLNVACHHGLKDNQNTSEVSFGWNGKRCPFCLCGVLNDKEEMLLCISCIACEEKWSCSFEDIQHLILSQEMQKRLFKICLEYWQEKHPGQAYPHVMSKNLNNTVVTLKRCENAFGDKFSVSVDTFDGDGQTDYFKNLENAFALYTGYN